MNNATQIVTAVLSSINEGVTAANLAAFLKTEVNEERVGYESPLAHIKRGLNRASSTVLRPLVNHALHAHFVNKEPAQWAALKLALPEVQLILERVDMAIAQVLKRKGGHSWATMDIKPLSVMIRSGIPGVPAQWVSKTLPEWVAALEGGEIDIEPLVANAEWELLKLSRVMSFAFLHTDSQLTVSRQGEWQQVPHHITRIKDSFERSLTMSWNAELNELYLAGDWAAFRPNQWFKLNRLLYSATAWVAATFGGNIERAVDGLDAAEVFADANGSRYEVGGHYAGSDSERESETVRASLMEEMTDLEEAVTAVETQVLYHVGRLPQCYGYSEMPAKIEMVEEGQFAGRALKEEVAAQQERNRADSEMGIVRGSAKSNRKTLNDALALLKLIA